MGELVSVPARIRRSEATSGVPDERPIPDLPIERPDFQLLYGATEAQAVKQDAIPPADEAMIGEKRTTEGGADVDVTEIDHDMGAFDPVCHSRTIVLIMQLGQSTSYVTLDKLAILTDPALSDRTLPSRLAPQRLRPSPCTLSELKRVDVVLVSHKYARLQLKDSIQPLTLAAITITSTPRQ